MSYNCQNGKLRPLTVAFRFLIAINGFVRIPREVKKVMKDATAKEKEPVHENGEATASEESQAKLKLRSWLNQFLRIKMTDGRVLTGAFLCTDRDANIILGSCYEYLAKEHTEARPLGLVTVPGRHIVSIHLDSWYLDEHSTRKKRLPSQSE